MFLVDVAAQQLNNYWTFFPDHSYHKSLLPYRNCLDAR
jgi:hypothetical protein